MIDESTKFQVLADHYNETFKVQREVSARRDRLFLFLLILLAVILFQLSAPNLVERIVDQYINHLVPSGILQQKICMLGNGMVVDPLVLLEEIEVLQQHHIDTGPEKLRILIQLFYAVELPLFFEFFHSCTHTKETWNVLF